MCAMRSTCTRSAENMAEKRRVIKNLEPASVHMGLRPAFTRLAVGFPSGRRERSAQS